MKPVFSVSFREVILAERSRLVLLKDLADLGPAKVFVDLPVYLNYSEYVSGFAAKHTE